MNLIIYTRRSVNVREFVTAMRLLRMTYDSWRQMVN